MKKLFAILSIAAIIISCNDADNKASAEADSARAAATADSLAAINAMADTSHAVIDTSMKPVDTLKKN